MKTLVHFLLLAGSVVSAAELGFSGPQEIEVTAEALSADDIAIQSYRASYSGTEGPWTVEAGIGFIQYRETYVPVLFGTTEKLDEETLQADLTFTRKFNEQWSASLLVSAYDGFSDYRSIWISEYYRQLFGAFPDYHGPDPHGQSIGAKARWDYLPGTGRAELSFNFGRDEIAPGWGFNSAIGKPEPGVESLSTAGGGARVEQALNGWLKTDAAIALRHITDRKTRVSLNHSWVAAAGPLAFRLSGGYSEEPPSFDSSYVSALVEWTFLPHWSANVGYRIYQDSGEIASSGFDALAPPVRSTEIFGGLAWDHGDFAVSAGVGLLATDYDALSEDNEFFGNLYRDRDWLTFRLAASHRF